MPDCPRSSPSGASHYSPTPGTCTCPCTSPAHQPHSCTRPHTRPCPNSRREETQGRMLPDLPRRESREEKEAGEAKQTHGLLGSSRQSTCLSRGWPSGSRGSRSGSRSSSSISNCRGSGWGREDGAAGSAFGPAPWPPAPPWSTSVWCSRNLTATPPDPTGGTPDYTGGCEAKVGTGETTDADCKKRARQKG